MVRVILFDRLGNPLGDLSEDEVFGLVRTEKVNGEHSLTITTTRILEQGWRVLTCDARGIWREHVVYGTDALHDSAERPFGSYYCVWSVQPDLMGTRVSAMPGVINPTTAALALDAALGGTSRWSRGTVTQTTTGGASMYDTDGWSAMGTLVETWGGEVDTTIGVGSAGVVSRQVDLYDKQGDQSGRRRFDFGADIKSVRRRIEDGPLYCRITPRGRGEETEGGGYGRKITIESVNDGKDYLENPAMVDLAKLPDGHGGWEYPTLEVENPDIETPAELKAWAQALLEEYTVPKVTYEVDVMQLAREGADMHGASLGDAVQVVDRKFGGLRIAARVMEMTVNMLDEADAKLTIGQVADDLSTMFGGFGTRLNTVANAVYNMNGGTYSTAGFLSRLLERLNEEINADGGYAYITEGHGILCYDTAVSDPLVGSEASKVVEIKGGTIRIANTKTAQGAWEWKTVFTSGHIAANLINAANIVAGSITSANGNSYWDLDSNQLVTANMIAYNMQATGTVTTESTNYKTVISGGYINTSYRENSSAQWENSGSIAPTAVNSYRGLKLHSPYVPETGSTRRIGNLIITATAIKAHILYLYGTGSVEQPRLNLAHFGTPSDNNIAELAATNVYLEGQRVYSSRLSVDGAFSATGTKSRLVDTDSYDRRLLYSYETPTPMFGDIGSGTIDADGYCYVMVDDVFSETTRTDYAYQVFLQKCGEGDLWVAEKHATHFVVRGTPGLQFDWELKARQMGFEHLRLENEDLDELNFFNPETAVLDLEMAYPSFIDEIEGVYAEE